MADKSADGFFLPGSPPDLFNPLRFRSPVIFCFHFCCHTSASSSNPRQDYLFKLTHLHILLPLASVVCSSFLSPNFAWALRSSMELLAKQTFTQDRPRRRLLDIYGWLVGFLQESTKLLVRVVPSSNLCQSNIIDFTILDYVVIYFEYNFLTRVT